jgi:hypothetical protein
MRQRRTAIRWPTKRTLTIWPSTVAQVNERFVQSANYWCGNQGQPVPSGFYEYSLTLTQPVSVTAGSRYWVGIQALIADSPSAVFGDAQCEGERRAFKT